MRSLIWNAVLAVAWAAMTGMSPLNLVVGFAIGFAILHVTPAREPRRSYFRKVRLGVRFAGFFFKELVISTLRIAYDVLTPTHYMRPAVVGIPLDAQTDAEIAMLAIVVTLTPGTMALDVSEDRKTLWIHGMYVPDPNALRKSIKQGFERRILELLR